MKFLCVLCALIPLCTAQVDLLDRPRADIASLKSSVEVIISDLAQLDGTLQSNTEKKFNYVQVRALKNINSTTGNALKEVSIAVQAANRQGRKAGVCYVDAERSLKTIKNNGVQALNVCEKKTQKAIEPMVKEIESSVKFGRSITYELDQLYLVCYAMDPKIHAGCINQELLRTRRTVSDLKSTVLTLKRKERLTSGEAYNVGKTCCDEAEKSAQAETSGVLLAASKCVRNAK